MRILTLCLFLVSFLFSHAQNTTDNFLKSVVYDFDGLSVNQTDLPEGDYSYGDLSYKIIANPLLKSDMLGDRVLELNLNWQNGYAAFGKGISRFIEFDVTRDRFNFYFYNPLSNGGDAHVIASITEDDDKDHVYNASADDKWIKNLTITRSAEWQLISIPLNDFTDANAGGNGIFDAAYTGAAGMIFVVELRFEKAFPIVQVKEQYLLDMMCFSDGPLPTGATILDLPVKDQGDYCRLGAYSAASETNPSEVPAEIEGLFLPGEGKKIKYVNYFHPFSKNGIATANFLPGQNLTGLFAGGYIPILTWEPMYIHLPTLDPKQPRLSNIINGEFDSYIDAFADKLKAYNDTMVVRLMHEFDGDWYAWSISQNNEDPALFIQAFRHIVNRCRARGANKVKWMWCMNALPNPNRAYNWAVNAYPGDQYVDIVATDIYNHPQIGIPDWKSFKYAVAESYYYLAKYFPSKTLLIGELGCRERDVTEDNSSQTKGGWLQQMNKALQSDFHKVRGLVFFNSNKEHDWRINTSATSRNAVASDIWADNYYFNIPTSVEESKDVSSLKFYPNPFSDNFTIDPGTGGDCDIHIYDILGHLVLKIEKVKPNEKISAGVELKPGFYLIRIKNEAFSRSFKIIKTEN